MELKKNPKADIKKNSAFYYAVGIAAVMLIAFLALNHKTYDKIDFDVAALDMGDLDDEEIPLTEILQTPPPPPPPAAPEVIEIVEDEEEIEETVIESTETDDNEEIVEPEEVEVVEVEEDVEVPFSIIENVAVFPGCERKKNNADRKKCMSEKISKFINKKFNTDLAADLGLTGRQKIFVGFKVDKKGNVVNVNARAPHPELKKEMIRVIKTLPKMQPGKQRGKPVKMPFSIPVIFAVQD
jgi:periplasmic protein TonB